MIASSTTTAAGTTMIQVDYDTILVQSATQPTSWYILKHADGWRCTCPASRFRGTCRHRAAVFAHLNPVGETRIVDHDTAPLAVGSTDASGIFYAETPRAAASGPCTFESLFGGIR